MFNCMPYTIGGVTYLAQDLNVECFTPIHNGFRALAGLLIAFFGAGFPLVFAFLLRRQRAELADAAVFARLGFLYDGYTLERGLYAWESIVMVRKAVVVMIGSLVKDAYNQLFASVTLLVVALLLQSFFQPYKRRFFNIVEGASLATIILTQMLSMFYLRADSLVNVCAGKTAVFVVDEQGTTCADVTGAAATYNLFTTVALASLNFAFVAAMLFFLVRLWATDKAEEAPDGAVARCARAAARCCKRCRGIICHARTGAGAKSAELTRKLTTKTSLRFAAAASSKRGSLRAILPPIVASFDQLSAVVAKSEIVDVLAGAGTGEQQSSEGVFSVANPMSVGRQILRSGIRDPLVAADRADRNAEEKANAAISDANARVAAATAALAAANARAERLVSKAERAAAESAKRKIDEAEARAEARIAEAKAAASAAIAEADEARRAAYLVRSTLPEDVASTILPAVTSSADEDAAPYAPAVGASNKAPSASNTKASPSFAPAVGASDKVPVPAPAGNVSHASRAHFAPTQARSPLPSRTGSAGPAPAPAEQPAPERFERRFDDDDEWFVSLEDGRSEWLLPAGAVLVGEREWRPPRAAAAAVAAAEEEELRKMIARLSAATESAHVARAEALEARRAAADAHATLAALATHRQRQDQPQQPPQPQPQPQPQRQQQHQQQHQQQMPRPQEQLLQQIELDNKRPLTSASLITQSPIHAGASTQTPTHLLAPAITQLLDSPPPEAALFSFASTFMQQRTFPSTQLVSNQSGAAATATDPQGRSQPQLALGAEAGQSTSLSFPSPGAEAPPGADAPTGAGTPHHRGVRAFFESRLPEHMRSQRGQRMAPVQTDSDK